MKLGRSGAWRCWPGRRVGEQIRDQLGKQAGRRAHQLPLFVLRILCQEVRQEFGVSEVLQARGVIGHDIGLSWDALGHVAVSVLPLVFCSKDTLLCRCPFSRDGFLGHSGLGGGVVHERGHSGALDWVAVRSGADLREHGGVF